MMIGWMGNGPREQRTTSRSASAGCFADHMEKMLESIPAASADPLRTHSRDFMHDSDRNANHCIIAKVDRAFLIKQKIDVTFFIRKLVEISENKG